jgi:hypothetical protein
LYFVERNKTNSYYYLLEDSMFGAGILAPRGAGNRERNEQVPDRDSSLRLE